MLILKAGVDLRGFSPEAAVGLMVALHVYAKHGLDLVLTSGLDGRHMEGSLHYKGKGFDLRLPTRLGAGPGADERIADELREALGGADGQFDVLLEDTHIHVEFDPPYAGTPTGLPEEPRPGA